MEVGKVSAAEETPLPKLPEATARYPTFASAQQQQRRASKRLRVFIRARVVILVASACDIDKIIIIKVVMHMALYVGDG